MFRVTSIFALLLWTATGQANCLPPSANLGGMPGYITSYQTTISDADRQNSAGKPIEGFRAYLLQDRANVNRFDRGGANEQKDDFFATLERRQMINKAQLRGRCGKDYAELTRLITERGQEAEVAVHVFQEPSALVLYVELRDDLVAEKPQPTPAPRATASPPVPATPPVPTQAPRKAKSYPQMLLDRLGPNGWALCSSSQIAVSALIARDGSLPQDAVELNRLLGEDMAEVRQLLLSQGYPSSGLDKLFSYARSNFRTGDEAFKNVADCLRVANDEYKKFKNR